MNPGLILVGLGAWLLFRSKTRTGSTPSGAAAHPAGPSSDARVATNNVAATGSVTEVQPESDRHADTVIVETTRVGKDISQTELVRRLDQATSEGGKPAF